MALRHIRYHNDRSDLWVSLCREAEPMRQWSGTRGAGAAAAALASSTLPPGAETEDISGKGGKSWEWA